MGQRVLVRGLAEGEVFRVSSTLNSNNHHSYAPFRYVEGRKRLFYHEEQYYSLFLPWGKVQLDAILLYFGYTLELISDRDWVSYWVNIKLEEAIDGEVIQKLDCLREGDVFGPLSLDNKFFCYIYKLYSAQFHYQHWVEEVRPAMPQQPVLRVFSDDEVKLLTQISEEVLAQTKEFSKEHLLMLSQTNLLQDLAECIRNLQTMNRDFIDKCKSETDSNRPISLAEEDFSFLEMLDAPDDNVVEDDLPVLEYPRDIKMFVKLLSSSAKNEQRVVPLYTVQQIIEFITGRVQFLQQDFRNYFKYHFDTPIGVVMMPWNESIDAKSEFRVFIRNRHLIAISQQAWYTVFHYTPEEIRTIASSIAELFNQILRDRLPLPSAILDVTVDFDIQQAYLIEINPWGTWATSGSSLFDWVKDHSIIEPNLQVDTSMDAPESIYLRFLHTIPYEESFVI